MLLVSIWEPPEDKPSWVAQFCALGQELGKEQELGQVVLMLLIHKSLIRALLSSFWWKPGTHGLSTSSLSSPLHSAQTLNKAPGMAGHPLGLGKGFSDMTVFCIIGLPILVRWPPS